MKKVILIFVVIIHITYVFSGHQSNANQLSKDLMVKMDNSDDELREQAKRVEYSYVIPDIINEDSIPSYSFYKILSKDAGAYFCISIFDKEYKISDILDYGQLNLKVYQRDDSIVLLIGLDDFYGSTYFVYLFRENALVRIGQIDIEQPEDVEEHGSKAISFKVYCEDNIFIIENYLDNIYDSTTNLRI